MCLGSTDTQYVSAISKSLLHHPHSQGAQERSLYLFVNILKAKHRKWKMFLEGRSQRPQQKVSKKSFLKNKNHSYGNDLLISAPGGKIPYSYKQTKTVQSLQDFLSFVSPKLSRIRCFAQKFVSAVQERLNGEYSTRKIMLQFCIVRAISGNIQQCNQSSPSRARTKH